MTWLMKILKIIKILTRGLTSDKILRDKALMDIKEVLLQWFIIFLIKKSSSSCIKIRICKTNSQQKMARINYQKRKVQSLFIDNIQVADLPDMRLITKFNIGIRFLLCVTNVYSSCEWVITLKDKKSLKITNAFQNILK